MAFQDSCDKKMLGHLSGVDLGEVPVRPLEVQNFEELCSVNADSRRELPSHQNLAH